MKKKLSIILIAALLAFAFMPVLTLAQEQEEDPVVEEQEAVEEEAAEETEKISEELEEILEADYQTAEEFLSVLEENELLSTVEKITLEQKLSSYEENLSMESITSVVDKVLTEKIALGQGFVILNNLEESVLNGYEEEKALALLNSYQNQENSGQLAFQTALELRKLSREDLSEEQTVAFSEQIAAVIEENGEIETSELKQLAAEYRKKAREEEREQRKINKAGRGNSASENALEKVKAGKGPENGPKNKDNGNKGNKGKKGKSNNSKAGNKGQGNS